MLKELLITSMLVFGVRNAPQPKEARNSNTIYGNYCLNNEYNFPSDLWNEYGYLSIELEFDTPSNRTNSNAFVLLGNFYFLESLQISLDDDNSVLIDFYYYDYNNSTTYHTNISMFSGDTIDDFDYDSNLASRPSDLYVSFFNSYMLNEQNYMFFNYIFTPYGNDYVRTYTGYYNLSNQYLPSQTNFTGFINANNTMYNSLTTNDIDDIGHIFYFNTLSFNISENKFVVKEFNQSNFANFNRNMYLSDVMMTNTSYNKLASNGVFGYVQPSGNNADFYDLFYSLADTPIYFIFSLFDWELLGVNLFMAIIGLMSFALVILLFRRFAFGG